MGFNQIQKREQLECEAKSQMEAWRFPLTKFHITIIPVVSEHCVYSVLSLKKMSFNYKKVF